jgi:Cys-rich repeat protein
MRLRFGLALLLPVTVGCGQSDAEGKKQQSATDAAPDTLIFGSGGFVAETGGQSSIGASSGQTGSGGTLGTGGSRAGSGGSIVTTGTGGAGTGGSAGGAVVDGGSSGGDAAGSDAGTCISDGDCRAPNRFCDVGHGVCVECLSDNHCPQGQTCGLSDHVCKFACTTSADCKDPRPYCDTQRGECVECLGDANCSTGNKHVCESKTRTCVECAANADCLCLLPGQVPCCTTTNLCTCGLLVCL